MVYTMLKTENVKFSEYDRDNKSLNIKFKMISIQKTTNGSLYTHFSNNLSMLRSSKLMLLP